MRIKSQVGIAILFSIIFCSNFHSQTKNFIDKSYLETRAKVDTLVTPDQIYFSIRITEKDTKGKISVEELENKMNDKLKSLGIDAKKQLRLTDAASNFKKYLLRRKDIHKNKSYELLVYDAVTAGRVIQGLEAIDIANVNLSKTKYSKMEALKLLLKQRAVYKGKMQAEYMLKPLNQKLGKAIYISDTNNVSNNYYARASDIRVSYAKEKSYEPIDIEFQKIRVETTVNINFEIE